MTNLVLVTRFLVWLMYVYKFNGLIDPLFMLTSNIFIPFNIPLLSISLSKEASTRLLMPLASVLTI